MRCNAPFADRLRDHVERKIKVYERNLSQPNVGAKKRKEIEKELLKLKGLMVEEFLKEPQLKLEEAEPELKPIADDATRIHKLATRPEGEMLL
jgi:hypothetical protein